METQNQIKSIGRTIGFACVIISLLYLGFFVFSRDLTPPTAALVGVAVGTILILLAKRRK